MLGNYVKAVARFRTLVGGLLYKIPSNWSGVGSHGRSLGLSEFFWPRVPVATSPSHKPTETHAQKASKISSEIFLSKRSS